MAKVTEEKIKIKVTKHPREVYYSGAQRREHMCGMVQFLNTNLTIPSFEIIDPWLDTLLVDDIVGVEHHQYKVTELVDGGFVGINLKTKKEFTSDPDRLTVAIGSGFAEILYRDGTPFGTELEKEVTVRTIDHTQSETASEEDTSSTSE